MHNNMDLLTITQWLSPGFPVGAFAYSHGLETAITEGWVHNQTGLQNWLRDLTLNGSVRSDAIWLRLAHAADGPEALMRLNQDARAFAPARSRLIEAERQGAAFLRTVASVWGIRLPDMLLPLAVGAAARQQSMNVELVVPLFAQAFLSNMVSAAQRLMPLGQSDAHAILSDLQDDILTVTEQTIGAGPDMIYSNAFMSDIAAMRHETLEPRTFQS